jgi:hypothetical protein
MLWVLEEPLKLQALFKELWVVMPLNVLKRQAIGISLSDP